MVYVTLLVAWADQHRRIVELRPATHGDVQVTLRNGVCLVLSRTWRERVERLCPIRS